MNGVYDFGWLGAEAGIAMPPSDRLEEVGALATTVDENLFRYSLDALCERYGLPGKDETLLREAVEAAGFAPRRKKINVQEHIWQLPARYVGPYAEADAATRSRCSRSSTPILDRERTRDAYRLEVDLMPMVLEMRRRGIRIDQDAAEQARDLLLANAMPRWPSFRRSSARRQHGRDQQPQMEGADLRRARHRLSAHGEGQPIIRGRQIRMDGEARALAAAAESPPRANTMPPAHKFLEGHILKHIVNGRIHAEIHPFRADDGGTRSSRFSYSDPPLQQMPARDKELGPLIRGVFLPEEGEFWAKPDISQQEFRFIVHYAMQHELRGAQEAADVYRNNPDADFHAVVAEMTGLDRDSAKATNFAKIYGAGVKKLAEMIGKPLTEVQAIVTQYDRKLPFVSGLSTICQEKASRVGYTELYDGARRHWNL